MADQPNYFAAPSTSPRAEEPGPGGGPSSARDVFLSWERLRVVYNAILVAETVLAGWTLRNDRMFQAEVAVGAIVANIAFCAGPVGEGYLDLLGVRRPIARAILMTGGTILAMVGVLLVVIGRFLNEF